MNLDFSLYMPTRILFGCGKLGNWGRRPSCRQEALIVIGASGAMRKQGYLRQVTRLLKSNGAASVVFDKIQPNPVFEHVEEAPRSPGQQVRLRPGLGGGSTIDSARASP